MPGGGPGGGGGGWGGPGGGGGGPPGGGGGGFPNSPPGVEGLGRGRPPFRVDTRSWGDHKRLDLAAAPAAYKTWRQRALDFLSRDRDGYIREDVRQLLVWVEKQGEDITADKAEEGARAVGLADPVAQVSTALYPAVRGIVADTVMHRSERCQGAFGLELWRRLYMEWRAAARQIAMVQAEQYQFPQRASSVAAL